MIVKVKNYGLVRNQTIEFKPGLNVIRGESGSGKSTVIRGIEGAIFNASGDSYVTQGESKAEIEITYNEHTVKRVRDIKQSSKTIYYVDNEKFSKVGVNPVDKVLDAFSIKEIKISNGTIRPNFLSQFSVPFLINESPAKIFDYLTLTSKATNLKDIDVSMTEDIKALNAEKKSKIETIDTLKRMISSAEEIIKSEEEFNKIYEAFKKIESKYETYLALKHELSKLNDFLIKIEEINNKISRLEKLLSDVEFKTDIFSNIQVLKNINNNLSDINNKKTRLLSLDTKLNSYDNIIKNTDTLCLIENKLSIYKDISSLVYNKIIVSNKIINDVSNKIKKYSDALEKIKDININDFSNKILQIEETSNLIKKISEKNNLLKTLEKDGVQKKKLFEKSEKEIEIFRKENMNMIVCSTVKSLCEEFEISMKECLEILDQTLL